MGSKQPGVRAAAIHDVLEYLDTYSPGLQDEVRATIPGDVQDLIDSTSRMGWVDVEDDIFVVSGIWEVLGDADASEMMSRFVVRHLELPYLKTIVTNTARMFGLSPSSLMRMLPIGWGLVYRNVCTSKLASLSVGKAELAFEAMAPSAIRSEAYLSHFRAVLESLFRITEVKAEVVIQDRRLGVQHYA